MTLSVIAVDSSRPTGASLEPVADPVQWADITVTHFDVAAAPNRNEYMVAGSTGLATGYSGVAARRLAADGTPIGPLLAVGADSADDVTVAYSSVDDTYLVAWTAPPGDAIHRRVHARVYSGAGSALTAETPITPELTSFACNFQGPKAAAHPGGGFVVAYHATYGSVTPGADCGGLAPGTSRGIVAHLSSTLAELGQTPVPNGANTNPGRAWVSVHPTSGDVFASFPGAVGVSALLDSSLTTERTWSGDVYLGAADSVTGNWLTVSDIGEVAVRDGDGDVLATADFGSSFAPRELIALGDGTWLVNRGAIFRRVRLDASIDSELFNQSGLSAQGFVGMATLGDGTALAANIVASNSDPSTVVFAVPPLGALSLAPGRYLDTRPGGATVDGQHVGDGPVGAGQVIEVPLAGRGSIPAGAVSVMANVTVVDPDNAGFVTAYPCDVARPNSSSVNYDTGQTVPNAVSAKLSATGSLCLYTLASAQLIVDVNGYSPAGTSLTPLTPVRLLETRPDPGFTTIDGAHQGSGLLPGGATYELDVIGRGGVPIEATSVVLNVTAAFPVAPGFLTVFPCGAPRPNSSNVNYDTGGVVPNQVVASVGTGGKVCIFSSASTHVIADVNAASAASSLVALSPGRVLDTRSGFTTVDGQSQGIGPVAAGQEQVVQVTGRAGVPSGAKSAILNVIAIEPGGAGFLTVHPCSGTLPVSSNVNYSLGDIVSNAVFAQLSSSGSVCVYTLQQADLVVDVLGYSLD